jgi:hypothetical protein
VVVLGTSSLELPAIGGVLRRVDDPLVVVMTVHVLGHLLRALALTLADLKREPTPDGREATGMAWRGSLVALGVVAGIAVSVYAVTYGSLLAR